jgi:hypothetical protein
MEVSVELAQKIINYLATRPYAEVHTLIGELAQCKAKEVDDARED